MSDQNLADSLALLCRRGLAPLLGVWLLETLQMRLSSSVAPEFWSGLKQPENELEERGRAWVLLTAFRTLLDRLDPFLSKRKPCGGSLLLDISNISAPQAVWRSWGRGSRKAAVV